jgi:hypothetical protein
LSVVVWGVGDVMKRLRMRERCDGFAKLSG